MTNSQAKWKTAYECASRVYESIRYTVIIQLFNLFYSISFQSPSSPEERMALDFSAIVLNAIISIETNKVFLVETRALNNYVSFRKSTPTASRECATRRRMLRYFCNHFNLKIGVFRRHSSKSATV